MRRIHGFGKRGCRNRSGQTLILAVMILVVILTAIMIFFDIHNAIRAKVKSQNAVDAAALAGANWQMHTLNLIGELNLVKAADVLISADALGIAADPETYMNQKTPDQLAEPMLLQADLERVEAEKEKLRAALDLVTEMQTRLSFVGPLIGFGAAQQAAKNNGLAANTSSGKLLRELLYDNILDDSIYGNEQVIPQIINGYAWRRPYGAMIGTLLDISEDGKSVSGVAAFPRFTSLGTLSSTIDGSPFSSFLTRKEFYDAVMGNNWCAVMDFLDRAAKRNMSGAWWGKFEYVLYESGFLKESEILPVHVDFFEGEEPGYQAGDHVKKMLEERNIRPLSSLYDKTDPYPHTVSESGEVTYTGSFDERGRPVRDSSDTELRLSLPEVSWAVFDDDWSSYSDEKKSQWSRYLSGEFRPGMDHSGALSYFEAGLSMRFPNTEMAAGAFRNTGGKGAAGKRMRQYARSAAESGDRMKYHGSSIVTSSSAKPIGKIRTESGTDLPPFGAGGLILPVFTHSILIPISLDPPDGFSFLDVSWFYFSSEFLPILGQSASLEEAKAEAEKQHPDHASHYDYFYRALQKMNDEQWRQTGLAWLNAPVDYYVDEQGVEQVKSRNRDHCFDWPTGCTPGGRWGPSILH